VNVDLFLFHLKLESQVYIYIKVNMLVGLYIYIYINHACWSLKSKFKLTFWKLQTISPNEIWVYRMDDFLCNLTVCSSVHSYRRFGATCHLHFPRKGLSTVNTVAVDSSKMSLLVQHASEDNNVHTYSIVQNIICVSEIWECSLLVCSFSLTSGRLGRSCKVVANFKMEFDQD